MSETKEKQKKLTARGVVALCAALLFAAVCLVLQFAPVCMTPALSVKKREEGEVRLHVLDVGQGDCSILEFSEGDVLVVDGSDGSFRNKNKIARYLKGLSPNKISLLLTHADMDHYGGFPYLLKAFDIETCYLPALASQNEEYLRFLEAVEEEGCATETLVRYGTIEREGAYVVCLSPRSLGETDENDSSAVLYLNAYGSVALLCGDISAQRERLLLREYALDRTLFDVGGLAVSMEEVDILKAAHHGSADSSCEEWLSALSPERLIVSCGRDNRYKLPAGEPFARYRALFPQGKIYRTDELGDIVVSFKEQGYTVDTAEE